MKKESPNSLTTKARLTLMTIGIAVGATAGILVPMAANSTTTNYATGYPNGIPQNQWVSSPYPGWAHTTSSSVHIQIQGSGWFGVQHGQSRNLTTYATYGQVSSEPNQTVTWVVPNDKVQDSCWWTWPSFENIKGYPTCKATHS